MRKPAKGRAIKAFDAIVSMQRRADKIAAEWEKTYGEDDIWQEIHSISASCEMALQELDNLIEKYTVKKGVTS